MSASSQPAPKLLGQTDAATAAPPVGGRDLAGVFQFIERHACEGIGVEDVARHAHVSRSSLERHFKRATRRSVKAEIDRIRFRRAVELLLHTDAKLETIARDIGYSSAAKLVDRFKRLLGVTPARFRQRKRRAHAVA